MGSEVVESVLKEFFEATEEGYKNRRADLEIREYHGFIDKQRKNGKLGGRPKKTQRKPTANPDLTQIKPNQEPVTSNHKPKNTATFVASPDGVSSEVWESFVKQRKAKRAQLTDMVINNIKREAESAGWSLEDALKEIVVRNWQSFKADWVAKPANKADQVFTTVPSRFERDPALIAVEQKLKEAVPMPPEIRAAMERLRK
jgi:hypothetical protein